MEIKDYEGKSPLMLPERFLVGSLEGWGVLEGPLGGLKARYTIEATGTWDEASSTVTFIESWTFDYGQVETLRWSIRKRGEGAYEDKEPKVDGVAIGEQAGFVYHWSYTRDTPQQDGSSVTLNFDDWFYLIDERTCIVRGTAGRLGLPFAVAYVTYRKL